MKAYRSLAGPGQSAVQRFRPILDPFQVPRERPQDGAQCIYAAGVLPLLFSRGSLLGDTLWCLELEKIYCASCAVAGRSPYKWRREGPYDHPLSGLHEDIYIVMLQDVAILRRRGLVESASEDWRMLRPSTRGGYVASRGRQSRLLKALSPIATDVI